VRLGVISGVPTSPKGPKLNHLFFVDDNLLFCKANSVEWRRLLRILGIYEAGSGQKLNLQKTSIFSVVIQVWRKNRRFFDYLGSQRSTSLIPILGCPPL
jgi:hypothetical protein